MKRKSRKVIVIVVLIFIILILAFCVKKVSEDGEMWGGLPIENVPQGEITSTNEDLEQGSNGTNTEPQENTEPKTDLIYHDQLDIWEETLTGGGTPAHYTDGDGNSYTKKYFTSLGYSMYIPDDWERYMPSTSYMNDIYYLVSKKPGYENIQLSIATKTNTGKLSVSEARDNFITTQNGLEYYYLNGAYRLSVAMYSQGDIHEITTKDIPGFENIEEDKVLVYYDEPSVTFTYDLEPTYYANPYVINYYIIKENVSIMVTAIGPRKEAVGMNYLLATMCLNCKELLNDNANAIRYSEDKEFDTNLLTVKVPDNWKLGTGTNYVSRIVCSEEPYDPLYGTEILLPSKVISSNEVNSPEDIINNIAVQKSLVFSAMKFNPDLSEMVTRNLDYSISYQKNTAEKKIYADKEFTIIDYTVTVDENSLAKPLALLENPFRGKIYITNYGDHYIFFSARTTTEGLTFIDNLMNSLLSTVVFY